MDEDVFDHIVDDLRRSPYMIEDDIDFYLESTAARLAASSLDLPPQMPPSPTELDVLRCASHGLTTKMTASVLGISYEMVNDHLAKVRSKLRAKNTAQAVGNAIRQSLIP